MATINLDKVKKSFKYLPFILLIFLPLIASLILIYSLGAVGLFLTFILVITFVYIYFIRGRDDW